MPIISFEKKLSEVRIKQEVYEQMLHNIEEYPELWENVSQYVRSSINIMNRAVREKRLHEWFGGKK